MIGVEIVHVEADNILPIYLQSLIYSINDVLFHSKD